MLTKQQLVYRLLFSSELKVGRSSTWIAHILVDGEPVCQAQIAILVHSFETLHDYKQLDDFLSRNVLQGDRCSHCFRKYLWASWEANGIIARGGEDSKCTRALA